MQRNYVYKSIVLHITIILLCLFDVHFFSSKREFDEHPPIIVDLENITISDMTNIPEKAVIGEEKKPATRKERPVKESFTPKEPEPKPEPQPREEAKTEPITEAPEIKTPSLIEEAPKKEEAKEDPKKESEEPVKKKPAPLPQRKPKMSPSPKPVQQKKPEPKREAKPVTKVPNKPKTIVKAVNPLESLMNSVDDLQKQIGTEDAPAQIPQNEPINNMGIEGGNNKGSYFSELSVSGIDFVKSKIQESWKTIAGDKKDIEVVISVKLTKEGVIQSVDVEDISRYRTDGAFQALADSAVRAIYIAQEGYDVFKVLATQSGSRYNEWKVIRFTFTPLGLEK